MIIKKVTLIAITGLFLALHAALAQQSGESASLRLQEQDRQIADEDTRILKSTEDKPEKPEDEGKDFYLDYGVWLLFDYRHYSEMDNDKELEDWIKQMYVLDTRVWARAVYQNMFILYGRLRNTYIWKPVVSNDYSGIGDDFEGPIVDSLYGTLYLHTRYNIPFTLKVGRQFLTLGRGIVYSDMHDGIEAKYIIGDNMMIKGFASKTTEFEDNIDYSVPGYQDEGDRQFFGAEGSVILGNNVIYVYGMIQRDYSHENPEDTRQNYTYDSEYVGAGLTGKYPYVSYWFEGIKEYGKSYTDATQTALERRDIDAWAIDTGLKVKLDWYSHPVLDAEVAIGSGDKHRQRVTNTVDGNSGGKDTNFLYFGAFNAGYALAPRLSNMHIYKFGITFKPLEFIPHVGENIAVGAKFYFYRKDRMEGGIYDVDATEPSPDIGEEIDGFVHWKVYENFYLTARYGIFFPGSAYPRYRRNYSEFIYLRARMMF